MKALKDFAQIYLCTEFVDMRNQAQGLSILVESQMQKSAVDGSLYVFCNKRRDLLKCLYWDQTGFAMWVKKLDQEKFIWPKKIEAGVVFLTPEQMHWLLSGVDIWQIKTHKKLHYEKIF